MYDGCYLLPSERQFPKKQTHNQFTLTDNDLLELLKYITRSIIGKHEEELQYLILWSENDDTCNSWQHYDITILLKAYKSYNASSPICSALCWFICYIVAYGFMFY